MVDSVPATILLVDDSEDNRYAVSRHLQKAGFRVVEAIDAAETLRLVADRPDLVVLDIDLPDMTGFEVCRVIKSAPATADIPVLHLSATFTKTRHRVQGLDGGADGYLCHPVEPLELVATVNALLRVKRAEAALREANRRKDEFLAMLAHELRNPLAPIRNAVEVMRLRDPGDPHLRAARDIVDRQAAHMARLVDDLLDVTRVGRGKVLLRRERLDLSRVVRETADDYRGAAEAGGLTLAVRVPDEPAWVDGDRTRLAQVIGNLLHNAIKFTDRGGRVEVGVAGDGAGRAAVTVRDTGIGVDADTLKTLFQPFAQADRSLDRSRGGLGLGLALVKGLAELHGGDVAAASDGPGRGTTLTVRLPLDPSAADRPAAPTLTPGDARRVLIVEDNLDSAASMRTLLEMLGHAVEVAHTGPDGADAARRLRPDVVLCDIGLPGGMDGFAVARAVRAESALDGVYLAALTGYGQEDDLAAAEAAGFDAHLTKPVDLATLQQVLTRRRGRTAGPPPKG